MSRAHAQKFIEHLQRDEVLRKKVNEASEHIIKVAKDHGYDVSREDLKAVIKERWSKQKEDEDDPAIGSFSEAPSF